MWFTASSWCLILSYLSLRVNIVFSECIWYGQCHVSENNKIQNCLYNGPAKRTTDKHSIQLLKKWCPHFEIHEDNSVETCCDVLQLRTLDENVNILKMFLGRCPSCFQNLLNIFCSMTCDPIQSEFINVTGTNVSDNGTFITSVDFYIMKDYGELMYDSCKDVFVPSANTLALDMICGSWGASRCTLERWFEYLGFSKINPYVPFDINYVWSNSTIAQDKYIPLNLTAVPCHKSLNAVTPKCSCLDCEKSCPVLINHHHDTVLKTDHVTFVVYLIIFLVIGPVVLCILCYDSTRQSIRADENEDLGDTKERDHDNLQIFDHHVNHENNTKYSENETIFLTSCFRNLGEFYGRNPYTVILISFLIAMGFAGGLYDIELMTDPIEMFSSKTGHCRTEREYYNQHFGPFYRVQQIIVKPVGLSNILYNSSKGVIEFGPVFNVSFLLQVKLLQDKIMNLGESENKLQHLCFSPLMPFNTRPNKPSKCLVQSIWGYYQNDLRIFNHTRFDDKNYTVNYLDHFMACSQNSYSQNCLGKYGGPINPSIAVGGFMPTSDSTSKNPHYEKATSVILTFLLNNHNNKQDLLPALSWEQQFISFMTNWTSSEKPEFVDVSFYSESSVEREVNREANAASFIVATSYVVMCCYVIFFVGRSNICKSFLVNSRIIIGVIGILTILISVASSFGLNSLFKIPVTLINLQVIPYFILTTGVYKIFVLMKNYQKFVSENAEGYSLEKCMGDVLAHVGPSMFLSCICESFCFFSAYLSDIPAVRSFALNAGVAVILNFILMMTCFVSILILDMKRIKNGKLDVLCCVSRPDHGVVDSNDAIHRLLFFVYEYFIFHQKIRGSVIFIFFVWFSVNLTFISKVNIGLDQEITVSKNSYLFKYFQDMKNHLSIGPPVYFVVVGDFNATDSYVQNMLCGGQHCNSDSVVNQIYASYKQSNRTLFVTPSSSWIDDYFDWSASEQCCRTSNNSFCPHDETICDLCNIELSNISRPVPNDFRKFLPYFLEDNPTSLCAKGGHAAYSQAVKFHYDEFDQLKVDASSFMTYHAALRTSSDFYNALFEARIVADNMTAMLKNYLGGNSNARVFPYSIFYVHYEQYLNIWSYTVRGGIFCILIIIAVTFVLKRYDTLSCLVVISIPLMTFVDLMTFMYFFNIQLNSLTLINIFTCIGISIEFSSLIIHKFNIPGKPLDSRKIANLLANIGSSIFLGPVCMNKFGLIILGCVKSTLFEIVYFRMYLAITALNTLHCLIFLPALLIHLGSSRIKKAQFGNEHDTELHS